MTLRSKLDSRLDTVSRPLEGSFQMGTAFRGAVPPSGPSVPIYDVIAPQGDERLDVTLLDAQILGIDCHWVIDPATRKGCTRLCYRAEGDCPYCGRERDVWLGCIGVIHHNRRCRAILRMGKESAKALARRSIAHFGLRGQRLIVRKVMTGRTSMMHFEESPIGPPDPVPHAHALDHTLCVVLQCHHLPGSTVATEDIPDPPVNGGV